jgi:hypothetical protein
MSRRRRPRDPAAARLDPAANGAMRARPGIVITVVITTVP